MRSANAAAQPVIAGRRGETLSNGHAFLSIGGLEAPCIHLRARPRPRRVGSDFRAALAAISQPIRDETRHGQDTLRQDLRGPRGRPPGRRHVHPLHRPPSRARGDEPAGVRRPAHGGPQGARAGEDAGRRRPQRADLRPQPRASRTRKAASRSRRWPRTPRTSASSTTTSATCGRASCT